MKFDGNKPVVLHSNFIHLDSNKLGLFNSGSYIFYISILSSSSSEKSRFVTERVTLPAPIFFCEEKSGFKEPFAAFTCSATPISDDDFPDNTSIHLVSNYRTLVYNNGRVFSSHVSLYACLQSSDFVSSPIPFDTLCSGDASKCSIFADEHLAAVNKRDFQLKVSKYFKPFFIKKIGEVIGTEKTFTIEKNPGPIAKQALYLFAFVFLLNFSHGLATESVYFNPKTLDFYILDSINLVPIDQDRVKGMLDSEVCVVYDISFYKEHVSNYLKNLRNSNRSSLVYKESDFVVEKNPGPRFTMLIFCLLLVFYLASSQDCYLNSIKSVNFNHYPDYVETLLDFPVPVGNCSTSATYGIQIQEFDIITNPLYGLLYFCSPPQYSCQLNGSVGANYLPITNPTLSYEPFSQTAQDDFFTYQVIYQDFDGTNFNTNNQVFALIYQIPSTTGTTDSSVTTGSVGTTGQQISAPLPYSAPPVIPFGNTGKRSSSSSLNFNLMTLVFSFIFSTSGKLIFNKRLLLFVSLTLFIQYSYAQSTCNSIPISISSINSCSGASCLTTQVANVAIPNEQGASACYNFNDVITNQPVMSFNCTVGETFFFWDKTYCYYTDDPVIAQKGYCHCSGATSPIPSSPNYCPNSGWAQTLQFGTAMSTDCFLGVQGNWCSAQLYTGIERYEVCAWDPSPKSFSIVTCTINNAESLSAVFTGKPVTFSLPSYFSNMTIISTTTALQFSPQFTVFDGADPEDDNFYAMDSGLVNGLNEQSLSKIGALKITPGNGFNGVSLPPQLAPSIVSYLGSCVNDVVYSSVPLTSIKDMLTNSRSLLNSYIQPPLFMRRNGTLSGGIIDNDSPTHEIPNWQYIGQTGIAFYYLQSIVFFGVGLDSPLFSSSTHGPPNIYNPFLGNRNNGTFPYSYYSIQPSGYYVDLNGVSFYPQIFSWTLPSNNGTFYTWCLVNYGTGSCLADNVTLTLQSYPTGANLTIWTYLGNLTQEYGEIYNVADRLLQPIDNGVINFQITYSNYSINFVSTLVTPKIFSVDTDYVNGLVIVTASSITQPGSCMIGSTPPGVISTQSIVLTTSPQPYTLPFSANFNGVLNVQIRCAQNVVNYGLQMSWNGNDVLPTDNALGIASFSGFTNPSNPGGNWLPGIGSWDDFWNNLNPFQNWSTASIYTIIGYILFAIGAIIFLIIFVKLCMCFCSKKLFSRMMPKRWSGKSEPPITKSTTTPTSNRKKALFNFYNKLI